ncbi:nucleoside hydrolase [Alteribacter natronophilus]|uniref:nucleoside hydrolase n=1 Tax=Alteribacter natronophilus TaxID=2583810 RepID=UPI00110DCE93|nr:nucleoside hydrolase [Alteribacter natronophilus]TMW70643.1 nucleoside hydrolase [Alteribacter natronophilus]
MGKVLLYADPGIDDTMAIIYALLHPDIELVGIVTGYGNVGQEQATQNVRFILELAGREDVPIFAGSQFPLSGETIEFYPEIHGVEGLGPIELGPITEDMLLNFTDLFDIIEHYGNELTIIDIGRLTSLATGFNLGGEDTMNQVNGVFVMGGAFFVPGNVTPLAEANFYGDPIAANLVMERALNLAIVPLNVTRDAMVTNRMVEIVTREDYNALTPVVREIFPFYSAAYSELQPGLDGAPFHDVLTVMAYTNPEIFTFIEKPVSVSTDPETRGLSISDFRPVEAEGFEAEVGENHWIAVDFDYDRFVEVFTETLMRSKNQNNR